MNIIEKDWGKLANIKIVCVNKIQRFKNNQKIGGLIWVAMYLSFLFLGGLADFLGGLFDVLLGGTIGV